MFLRRTALAFIASLGLIAVPAYATGPTSITVSPSTLQLTADQSVSLVVTAHNADNTTTDVTGQSVFSTNEPRATFTGATFQPGKVGSWSIAVSFEGLHATIPVRVTAGALAEMTINPNSAPEIIPTNRTVSFTVQGYDQRNNRVSTAGVVWSVSNPLGSISSKGVLTPSQTGEGVVTATLGTVTTTAAIRVAAARVTTPNTNTTATTNTNSSTNSNLNTNTPATSNLNVAGTTDDPATATTCSGRTNWLWGMLLLALLGGVAILYAFIPITNTWPAMIGLGAAVVLSIVERTYGCSGNAWWPWIAILGTAGLTVFAYQQTPKQTAE